MNILYLISYAGAAGTEKYVEELMGYAAREGHRCHLAYCVPGPLSEKLRGAGYPLLQLDMRPRRIFAAAKKLAAYCREQGIEVIHAQYPRENVIGLLSGRRCPGLRVVYTAHLTQRQGRAWNYANRMLTPRNHCVISVCRQGLDIQRENGVCPARLRYIPNGIRPVPAEKRDVIRQEFGLPPETFVMVTMARYAPEKGLGWLLAVLSRLREITERPFVCLIAGAGEEYAAVTAEIARRGLSSHVIQAGYRSDGAALLASADAYVSSALYNEAMSFAILEAMGAALPLAVTDVGAGAELAEGCGFAVAPGDTETMAQSLRQLAEDEALRLRLGKNAREKSLRDYSLDNTLRQTLAAYS